MLSNQKLVETFIEDSIRGRETLLANSLLTADSQCGINQLISKKDGLLMKVDLAHQPIQFVVRHTLAYAQWLHDLLRGHQLVTADRLGDNRFYHYKQFQVLPGYELNCETARKLWKSWRTIKRLSGHQARAKKLMIQGNQRWSEVQSIGFSNELLFIGTDQGEIVTHMDDAIFWLSQPAHLEKVVSASPSSTY